MKGAMGLKGGSKPLDAPPGLSRGRRTNAYRKAKPARFITLVEIPKDEIEEARAAMKECCEALMKCDKETARTRALLRSKDSQIGAKDSEMLTMQAAMNAQLRAKDDEIRSVKAAMKIQLRAKDNEIRSLKRSLAAAHSGAAATKANMAQEIRGAWAAHQAARVEGTRLTAQIQELQAEATAAQKDLTETQAELESVREEVVSQKALQEEATAALDGVKEELHLQQYLNATTSKALVSLAELQGDCRSLTADNYRLRQEKAADTAALKKVEESLQLAKLAHKAEMQLRQKADAMAQEAVAQRDSKAPEVHILQQQNLQLLARMRGMQEAGTKQLQAFQVGNMQLLAQLRALQTNMGAGPVQNGWASGQAMPGFSQPSPQCPGVIPAHLKQPMPMVKQAIGPMPLVKQPLAPRRVPRC